MTQTMNTEKVLIEEFTRTNDFDVLKVLADLYCDQQDEEMELACRWMVKNKLTPMHGSLWRHVEPDERWWWFYPQHGYYLSHRLPDLVWKNLEGDGCSDTKGSVAVFYETWESAVRYLGKALKKGKP